MAAFVEERPRSPAAMSYIRNTTIGGDTPVRLRHAPDLRPTRGHRHAHMHGRSGVPVRRCRLRPRVAVPGSGARGDGREVRPFAQPARPPGLPYDFQWHGLMGYMDGGIRIVGAHPRHIGSSTTSAATASGSCPRSTAASGWPGSSPARACPEHLRPALRSRLNALRCQQAWAERAASPNAPYASPRMRE